MSAIFIEKIRAWLNVPMQDKTPTREIMDVLITMALLGLVWLIGEIVYRWEERRR